MTDINKLTKAEEEVMQYLWEHGPATVSALIEKMEEPKPPHSTVSSIIRILESKGFVDHKTYGKTHEYFTIVAKVDYSKFSLKNLISNYFNGSVNELVTFMIDKKDLSLKDLEAINKIYKNKKS